jgi:hypothetical protein
MEQFQKLQQIQIPHTVQLVWNNQCMCWKREIMAAQTTV